MLSARQYGGDPGGHMGQYTGHVQKMGWSPISLPVPKGLTILFINNIHVYIINLCLGSPNREMYMCVLVC